jgi:hypothetical protein
MFAVGATIAEASGDPRPADGVAVAGGTSIAGVPGGGPTVASAVAMIAGGPPTTGVSGGPGSADDAATSDAGMSKAGMLDGLTLAADVSRIAGVVDSAASPGGVVDKALPDGVGAAGRLRVVDSGREASRGRLRRM